MARVGARPVALAARGAAAYQRLSGMHVMESPQFSRVVINPTATRQIADAYARMPSFNRNALPAYRAMREEVGRQFDHLTRPRSKGGMGIQVEATREDPYGAADWTKVMPEARQDFEQNHRLKVLSTSSTGAHPFFTNDENDMFRAVHDAFGHLASGRGVDKHGEDAAFQKHSMMFSPLARQAMATETRGQNAALHTAGAFQEQKIGLLPAHMVRPAFGLQGSQGEHANAVLQARQWNQRQGLL